MIDIMKLIINEFLIYEGILASVDNEINGFHASYWRSSLGYMKRRTAKSHRLNQCLFYMPMGHFWACCLQIVGNFLVAF